MNLRKKLLLIITNLATTTALKTNLGTTTALNAAENKIPNVGNLIKKAITQKLVTLKTELLAITNMVNILLLKNLIS